ncbi:UNVERIFIED_CONTAM: putative protein phosphatase 2C 10 [Sesamum angustifolium]|uniref:Protein-serine/threonine phosphatase n=1 Tax=Sesamum angustifolium TaxID=2727405 RepID=A0AAW2QBE5_9LAMI
MDSLCCFNYSQGFLLDCGVMAELSFLWHIVRWRKHLRFLSCLTYLKPCWNAFNFELKHWFLGGRSCQFDVSSEYEVLIGCGFNSKASGLHIFCIMSVVSCGLEQGSLRNWVNVKSARCLLPTTSCRRTVVMWLWQGRSHQGSAKYGYSLVKGKANHPMEDYHVAKFVHVHGHELGLFAIYDGHLGDTVPAYLQKHLFAKS